MGTKTIVFGVMAAALAVEFLYEEFDRATNYTKVSAVVETVDNICSINAGRKKLVDRDTEKLSYFDCDLAKQIAPLRGFSEYDIDKHYEVTFSYISPADSSRNSGKRVIELYSSDEYEVGKRLDVYASNEEPSKLFSRR